MLGILVLILENDLNSTIDSIIGMIVPILILIPLFILRMLGAGDIKLFCVIGLFLGPNAVIKTMIVSFIVGSIFAIIKIIRNQNIKQRARYFIQYMKNICYGAGVVYYDPKGDNYTNAVHFSVAIFIALCHRLYFDGGVV